MLYKVVFIYVYRCFACLHAVPYVTGACGGLERALDALELQLETVRSCLVDAEN